MKKSWLKCVYLPELMGLNSNHFYVFHAAKQETKKLKEDCRHKCVVTISSNAWTNEELTLQ